MIEPTPGMQLAVVVIGRNEGVRLKRCFDAVRAMRLPCSGMELVYVDSDSSDSSRRIAQEAGARVLHLNSPPFTAARGRDTGWRESSAPFILFIDGDSVIDPDFLSRALPQFDDPRVAVAFGRTREIDPCSSIFSGVYDLEWPQPPPGPAEYCLGTALMRRAALEAVNGHDTNLMAGEEPELCFRLRRKGYTILCLDIPMARHDIALHSLPQYWRRNVRRGYGDAEVSERFQDDEDSPSYKARTRRTRIWAPLTIISLFVAAVASIAMGSWVPPAAWLAAAGVLVLAAAWKCRRRKARRSASLSYGIHCYFKEIPLLFGQLTYYLDRYTGRKTWIEYKTPQKAITR